ncbi:MAG: formylglycine-generating enzyme family protein, partial [Dysgonamonadaceae bacterium]|nr:formylglycine-generating enzyme family protein [Dysgonamonadaceae bacterium]
GTSGTLYLYSGSNTIGDVAWYEGNNAASDNTNGSNYGTKEVATKDPNDLGLYDMSGNLWEWCWDELGGYVDCCIENPDSYDLSNTDFLNFLSEGSYRVIRGGNWIYNESYCHVSYRSDYYPNYRYDHVGFRVACKGD